MALCRLNGWTRHALRITRRFQKFGARTPETALSLAGVGRELAQASAEQALVRGLLARTPDRRWYATDRGRAALAGHTLPPMPHIGWRLRQQLTASQAH